MRKLQSTNAQNFKELIVLCPISYALSVMGGRWKALIIDRLLKRPMRYSELKKAIPPVAERILTLQLKELETDGLITKLILQDHPPKIVEYHLTERGEALRPILSELFAWGRDWGVTAGETA
jgi:DNA-binding HxlR family transcriptional regulator